MRHRRNPVQPAPATPTRPDKAWTSALVTLAGLLGIHLTNGTAQAIVLVVWVALSWYGVWRVRNRPKQPRPGPGVQDVLP